MPGTISEIQFLKGKTVCITESLTEKKIIETNMAWEICGLKNVWPQDEKILYTDKNDESNIKVFHV